MGTQKVLDLDTLLPVIQSARAQGKRVVTTNGCFDVLHVGHLRYLEAAKATGDILLVLLNSDASVTELKGPKRPLVPAAERAEMLAGLSSVDYVCIFDTRTPETMLEAIKPDIHVKGADYSAESLPEAKTLEALGTRLHFIPLIEGKSTTNIIQRIIESYTPTACNP